MERVSFLVEATGARLACLLNPDHVVVRRRAGVAQRRSLTGQLTGSGIRDDPLLFTGGGVTDLELSVLFDIGLAAAEPPITDVRDLTRPLWDLAENVDPGDGYRRPPAIRFVWGKAWNVPAVVASVAERLEHFAADGTPARSWLRLRLLRASDTDSAPDAAPAPAPRAETIEAVTAAAATDETSDSHEVVGAAGERLDELAARYYGNPSLWRVLAAVNGVADPPWVAAGRILRIPSLSLMAAAGASTAAAAAPATPAGATAGVDAAGGAP